MRTTTLLTKFGTMDAQKLSERLIGSLVDFRNGTGATIVEFVFPEDDPYRMHVICEGQPIGAYSSERGNYSFIPTYTVSISNIKGITEL